MKGMCKTCPKRNSCTELCPEALAYADQDYVSLAELLPQRPIKVDQDRLLAFDYRDMSRLTPESRKLLILLLHKEGKGHTDIACHIECDESYVREVIEKWDVKIQNRGKFAPKYMIIRKKQELDSIYREA